VTECETYREEILEAATVRGPMLAEAREHLESCEQCRSLFAAADSVARGVRSMAGESPSSETTDRILAAARKQVAQKRAGAARVRRWVAAGVVAASPALFVVGAWLLGFGEDPMDPDAVAALEERVDRGLDRVRLEMDSAWPEGGWGRGESRDVSSRIDRFQARLERFRTRSRSETFSLDLVPEEDERQREKRGHLNPFEWRHMS
jgi:hypothetical protein